MSCPGQALLCKFLLQPSRTLITLLSGHYAAQGQDLASGNLTAPAIYALASSSEPAAAEELLSIIESEFLEEGSLQRALELVHTTGEDQKKVTRPASGWGSGLVVCTGCTENRESVCVLVSAAGLEGLAARNRYCVWLSWQYSSMLCKGK